MLELLLELGDVIGKLLRNLEELWVLGESNIAGKHHNDRRRHVRVILVSWCPLGISSLSSDILPVKGEEVLEILILSRENNINNNTLSH